MLLEFSDAFYCLAIDLPGHGQTRVEGDESSYTMAKCAAGIVGLLDELKISKANLVGYSMGGRLALYLAVHYPQRWHKLIIESSSPGLSEESAKKKRWQDDQKWAAKLEQQTIQTFVSAWYRQSIFKSLSKHSQFKELRTSRYHNDPVELARSLRGMSLGKQESLWNKLAKIPLPTMMIMGEHDQKYQKIGEEMKSIYPALVLKIIDKSGHMSHFENPHQFAQQLRIFLETAHHS